LLSAACQRHSKQGLPQSDTITGDNRIKVVGTQQEKQSGWSCREDIASADEAVGAVANLLHQLAPNGDVPAAALALCQVSLDASASMVRCQFNPKGRAKPCLDSKSSLLLSRQDRK